MDKLEQVVLESTSASEANEITSSVPRDNYNSQLSIKEILHGTYFLCTFLYAKADFCEELIQILLDTAEKIMEAVTGDEFWSPSSPCCCCLPTPMTLASGGSAMFPLVVHQPASPSIWPAVQSRRRGLSTNPGVTMWCICGCS